MDATSYLEIAHKNIIILYHGYCTDGFGAAYAAWKKFGTSAAYIPCERNKDTIVPEHFKGKEVYVVDYSFSKEEMLACEREALSFTVLDHHISAKDDVLLIKNHVFDNDHSGAYIAWKFFHPETPVPKFIEYISDADTWTHTLPDWQIIDAYIYNGSEDYFTFERYDRLSKELSTEEGYTRAKEIGELLLASFNEKLKMYEGIATLVSFEGYEIYAVNAPKEVKSELGHLLAKKTNSFSLIFMYENGAWKCSLRSVDDFDVSQIAQKHGGGGHKNAAGFYIKADFPFPLARAV